MWLKLDVPNGRILIWFCGTWHISHGCIAVGAEKTVLLSQSLRGWHAPGDLRRQPQLG
jgi:hypothetical protein